MKTRILERRRPDGRFYRSFPIIPTFSKKVRFCYLDKQILARLLGFPVGTNQTLLKSYNFTTFFNIKFHKLSTSHVLPSFASTNGAEIHFCFEWEQPPPPEPKSNYEIIQDLEQVDKTNVVGVDPGVNNIFVCVSGDDEFDGTGEHHNVLKTKLTRNEFYHNSWSTDITNYQKKGMFLINFIKISNRKTSSKVV